MHGLKRIDRWLGILEFDLPLFGFCLFADRKIAPTLKREGMSSIENALDLLESDAGIFHVLAHTVCMGLERFNREFSPNSSEGKVILEKVIVPINMRDREDLKSEA